MADQGTTEAIKERLRTLTGAARSGGAARLADRVGMPFYNVNRYVHGPGVPPHDFLLAVARAFDVSLDWLYGRDGVPPPPDPDQPTWARRLESRLEFLEHQLVEQQNAAPAEAEAVRKWGKELEAKLVDELEQMRGVLAGHDQVLSDAVAKAIRNHLGAGATPTRSDGGEA